MFLGDMPPNPLVKLVEITHVESWIHPWASIAITVGGAVLNAAAFIGGNYLVPALGGGHKAAQEEKVGHEKSPYQAAYAT